MPTETYNPREKTFIKAPEIKTCPTCGQLVKEDVKPMNNFMNNYVSETGTVMTINSNDDTVTVQDVVMYKCDSKDKYGLIRESSVVNAKKSKPQVQQQVQQSTTVPTAANPIPVPINKIASASSPTPVQPVPSATQPNP